MTKKIYLVIVILLIISAYLLYSFPIQKYFAEKTLKEYMSIQGASDEKIQSKQILKDYKIGGYNIKIIYKDDLDFIYEYHYFPGKNNLRESIYCTVYNKKNVDVNITKEKIKYPLIN